jgi:formamidopyrimidine-DNA glycosylase
MPELPEVETLRRGLEPRLVGHRIVGTRVLVPKMLKGTITDPGVLARKLQDSQIESVGRRGKYLIFTLDCGYYLLLHLKMRGQLLVVPAETPDGKYLATAFQIENGQELRFHDMWTWGELRLLTPDELVGHAGLSAMGPEPFSEGWTPAVLRAALQKRSRAAIKAALLDQTLVAGVGNIYADESLFRSGIHSLRPAGSLSETEVTALHREIRAVLREATEGGGTTSDNYVDAEGSVGRYTPLVYDRAGKPCPSCGAILERIKVSGRGTVYCPSCQI